MKNSKTKIYLSIVVLLMISILMSMIYLMSDYKIPKGVDLGKGRKAEVIVRQIEMKRPAFKINKDNNVVKIIKDDKELVIDSSIFSDDEKRRIIKNVLYNVENENIYLYNSEQFKNDVNDFNSFFNNYDIDNDLIYLNHYGEYNVSYSLSYKKSSILMKFIHDNKDVKVGRIDIPIKNIVVDSNKPMVAFTFDDGPSINTIEIVNKLKEYNSSATFFMLGNRIDGKSEILTTIIESGSEIGGHSWDHTSLIDLSDEDLYIQFNWVKDVVKRNTDDYEIKLFRPPYGSFNDNVKSKSPYPLIMWSYDTLDWKTRKAKKTISNVLNNLEDGDIILMHDIHEETKEAVLELIPQIIDRGFQIVSVSQMFEFKGIQLYPGEVYYSAK